MNTQQQQQVQRKLLARGTATTHDMQASPAHCVHTVDVTRCTTSAAHAAHRLPTSLHGLVFNRYCTASSRYNTPPGSHRKTLLHEAGVFASHSRWYRSWVRRSWPHTKASNPPRFPLDSRLGVPLQVVSLVRPPVLAAHEGDAADGARRHRRQQAAQLEALQPVRVLAAARFRPCQPQACQTPALTRSTVGLHQAWVKGVARARQNSQQPGLTVARRSAHQPWLARSAVPEPEAATQMPTILRPDHLDLQSQASELRLSPAAMSRGNTECRCTSGEAPTCFSGCCGERWRRHTARKLRMMRSSPGSGPAVRGIRLRAWPGTPGS